MVVIDISPGEHKVKILYGPGGERLIMSPINFNFQAGRIYRIAPVLLRVVIEEITSEKTINKIVDNRKKAVFVKKEEKK